MPKNRCPVCFSRAIAYGIAPTSTNVLIHCNLCNFRDVVFYGDSRREAHSWYAARFVLRRYSVSRQEGRLGCCLRRLWSFQRCESPTPEWDGVVLLPLVRPRMGGVRRSLRISGVAYSQFVLKQWFSQ